MNKLILIGNGFDLAHGLPTSYKDFIDDFWANIQHNLEDDLVKSIIKIDIEITRFLFTHNYELKNFNEFSLAIKNLFNIQGYFYNEMELFVKDKSRGLILMESYNYFFKMINSKNSIENWVDIENEYFTELKKITKLTFGGFDEEKTKSARREKVILLNKEFEQIKNLFEKYLSEKVLQKFHFENFENPKNYFGMQEILKPFIVSKEPYIKEKIQNLSEEFAFKIDQEDILNYELLLSKDNFDRQVFKSRLLSFNYTPTSYIYSTYINYKYNSENCLTNYIHGEVNSKENKINFGFGDEMDDFYKEIENICDNEYLKNFKSFQYSNTTNYDYLLRYIDSDKYQVSILGHSCGLSDRLLLNTIFEHENCRSIKIYYHQKDDGSDNYTDMVQNISRHFKDKQSMRRKIVNKTLSSPLPQNVRFKEK